MPVLFGSSGRCRHPELKRENKRRRTVLFHTYIRYKRRALFSAPVVLSLSFYRVVPAYDGRCIIGVFPFLVQDRFPLSTPATTTGRK